MQEVLAYTFLIIGAALVVSGLTLLLIDAVLWIKSKARKWRK